MEAVIYETMPAVQHIERPATPAVSQIIFKPCADGEEPTKIPAPLAAVEVNTELKYLYLINRYKF